MANYNAGVNVLKLRNLFPTAGNETVGQLGTSGSPPSAVNSPRADRAPSEVAQAAKIGASGSPLIALAVFAVLLFALMFTAKHVGSEGSTFASIKLSVYNVLVISLAAIIGINFFKLVFTKIKIPGVSAMVLAA